MTREKKASITLELMMIGLTYKLNGNEMLSENEADSTRNAIDALDVAIAALRGPVPDPETGLVPCGCGGKAAVVPKDNGFYIVCDSCEVSTTQDSFFNGTGFSAQSLDDAREDWNTAMGWRVEE